jgi:hypothetical protein
VSLGVESYGANLSLDNHRKNTHVRLDASDVESEVSLGGLLGNPGASLKLAGAGSALELADKDGKVIWRAP